MSEVLDFIQRRWSATDANWSTGNCYWFARILTTRFPSLRIYYLPVSGHFVAGCADSLYFDHHGIYHVGADEAVIDFEELANTDARWYSNLVTDCVL